MLTGLLFTWQKCLQGHSPGCWGGDRGDSGLKFVPWPLQLSRAQACPLHQWDLSFIPSPVSQGKSCAFKVVIPREGWKL